MTKKKELRATIDTMTYELRIAKESEQRMYQRMTLAQKDADAWREKYSRRKLVIRKEIEDESAARDAWLAEVEQ